MYCYLATINIELSIIFTSFYKNHFLEWIKKTIKTRKQFLFIR